MRLTLTIPASRTLPPATTGGATTRPPLRLLTLSSLFPNPAEPNHGVFVENRLRHLLTSGAAEATVLAPVPWFPGRTPPRAAVPAQATRHGVMVHHPRFLAVPGLGMATNPAMLFHAARAVARRLLAQGHRFDILDGHYLFPDGVAAVRLARELGLPVVLTARGSDTSQLPHYRIPGRMIRAAIRDADALIAVSAALKEGLVTLGAAPEKVTVLRNGVDLGLFRPAPDRAAVRTALGFEGPTLLSVGHLIERKRNSLTIAALKLLPDHHLVLVGNGSERATLEALAERLGVAARVRFAGPVPHTDLPRWYTAADIMVLASSREGWANVLLESMACGTPVVATDAWGSREAVAAPEAGIVIDEATPEALAAAIRRLATAPPDRAATAAYAAQFSWDATTAGQLALFRRLLSNEARR
jgi:glycosyltransferase involved in cell wall biosynthesis